MLYNSKGSDLIIGLVLGVIIFAAAIFGGIEWYNNDKNDKYTEYTEEGNRLRGMFNYNMSNDSFLKAIEYRDRAPAHYQIGANYFDLKEYENAIEHYSKALGLIQGLEIGLAKMLFYHRALAYFNAKKYDRALDDVNQLIVELWNSANSSWGKHQDFEDKLFVSTMDIQNTLGDEIYGSTILGYEMLSNVIFYKSQIFDIQGNHQHLLLKNALFVNPDSEYVSIQQVIESRSYHSQTAKQIEKECMERNKKTKSCPNTDKFRIWEEILIDSKYADKFKLE